LRAVLDPNVIISATLSPGGSPARVFRLWLEGGFELVCSPLLLDELARAFTYPKLRKHIRSNEGDELLQLLGRGASMVDDSTVPPEVSSLDPKDDYLIALAGKSRSVLVSGDRDLLELSDRIPVHSPGDFLALIEVRS
jgi:putative PIN family toxin of toxin-antitoxin system